MAEKLQELGSHCVQQSALPREWGRSTIIFLGKPGKSTSDAANLRPICLLEPNGKVLMRVLGMALRDQVWNELQKWPLFAYQPGRSSHDAIRRVLHHCGEVKQLQFMLQHQIHRAASGAHLSLSGGLTVSLATASNTARPTETATANTTTTYTGWQWMLAPPEPTPAKRRKEDPEPTEAYYFPARRSKPTSSSVVLPHWAKPLWANTCREEKRKEGKEEREVEEEKER